MRATLVCPRFVPTYWSYESSLRLAGKKCLLPPLGLITVAWQIVELHKAQRLRAGRAALLVVTIAILSIAIGIVHNTARPLNSFAQVSNIGTELKKGAKADDAKSHYIVDRRKD